MKLGSLAVRGVIGPLFVGHGAQKLFGWFGGHGREGTAGFFETLGLKPGTRHATLAGTAEMLGGALLTVGALTPVAGTVLTSTMVTAIRKVHGSKGPWSTDGGYEYNAVVIAALMMVTEGGPGRPSVDASLLPRWNGARWAALQLAAGIAGSYLATSEQANDKAEEAVQTVAAKVPGLGDEDEPRFSREPSGQPAMDR